MTEILEVKPTARWLAAIRTYLGVVAVGNLVWEALQLPLYTIWQEGTRGHLVLAMFHGTGGDIFVAAAALMMSIVLLGNSGWPVTRFWPVATLTMAFGLGFTFYSEWMNVEVRHVWAYTALMPRLPVIGTGLSPVLQWIVVQWIAFLVCRRQMAHRPATQSQI